MGSTTVESVNILINAEDNASSVFKSVQKNAGGAMSKLGSFAKTAATGLAVVGGVATTALGAVGGFALNSANDLEKGFIKYETLLGSAEAAKTRMMELNKFSAETPFQLDDIMRADVLLQGFGIRSEKLLKTIGDAAAISGSSFGDLGLIMGQVSQTNDLENIKQLVERGVISFNELKQAGIEFAENGSVINSTEETYEAIVGIMEEKFGGGMEKLSDTISGKISTIKDTFTLALGTLAQDSGLLDFTKEFLDFVLEKLPPALAIAQDWFNSTRETIKEFTTPIIEFFRENKEPIMEFFTRIRDGASKVFNYVGKLGKEIFGGLSGFVMENKDHIVQTLDSFMTTAESVFGVIQGFVKMLKDAWDRDFLGITTRTKMSLSVIKYFGSVTFEILGGIIDTVSLVSNNWEYYWSKMKLSISNFANDTLSTVERWANRLLKPINTVREAMGMDALSVDLSGSKIDTSLLEAKVAVLKPQDSLGDVWGYRMNNIDNSAQRLIEELAQIEKEKKERDVAEKERNAQIMAEYRAMQGGGSNSEITINQYVSSELKDNASIEYLREKLAEMNREDLASHGVNID